MPLIECQHLIDPVSLGQNDDRSISETDPKVCVALDDLARLPDVGARHRRQLVYATVHLSKEARASGIPDSGRKQVVEFGQHER